MAIAPSLVVLMSLPIGISAGHIQRVVQDLLQAVEGLRCRLVARGLPRTMQPVLKYLKALRASLGPVEVSEVPDQVVVEDLLNPRVRVAALPRSPLALSAHRFVALAVPGVAPILLQGRMDVRPLRAQDLPVPPPHSLLQETPLLVREVVLHPFVAFLRPIPIAPVLSFLQEVLVLGSVTPLMLPLVQ